MINKRKIIAKRFLDQKDGLDFPPIRVRMGKFQNPTFCHINARQALEEGSANIIAETVYVTQEGLIRLHYVEKDSFGFVDNTLGYLSKDKKYYLIRQLTVGDVQDIPMHTVLNNAKKDLLARLFTEDELKKYKFKLTDL